MSNAALYGFIKDLSAPDKKFHRLALSREISNHLFLRSTLGTSSGELTEQDMTHILQRFLIVLQTLDLSTNGNSQTTVRLPAGPEAYAPKKIYNSEARDAETL